MTALCLRCRSVLGADGRCSVCDYSDATGNKTVVVPVMKSKGLVAPADPASDALGRIPLPEGWEISLDILEGPEKGSHHRISRSRVLIGRGGGEVALSDQRASRKHASVEVYGSTCVLIKDLGSTNGTFVNGRRVVTAELTDGDEIRIGGTKLLISIGAPPA